MSRYLIEQKRDGFIIRGRPHHWDVPASPKWLIELCNSEDHWQRQPVSVTLKPYCLEVISSEEPKSFKFFDFPPVVAEVAERLLTAWNPPVREHDGPDYVSLPSWIVRWTQKRTEWAVNKQIYAEWQRLLGQVDPTVLAVHKKVFAATWNCREVPLLSQDALYGCSHTLM